MVRIVSYLPSKKQIVEKELEFFPESQQAGADSGIWYDVSEYDKVAIEEIGAKIGIDPLTVEDILEGRQRVKFEDYPTYVYSVCKGVTSSEKLPLDFAIEELSIVVMQNLIVSFHQKESSIISRVIKAVLNRNVGTGKNQPFVSLVLYMLYDFSVDTFFGVVSGMDTWLISTGGDIMDVDRMKASDLAGMKALMRFISKARRQMNDLRILLGQFRDTTSMLQRGSVKYVSPDLAVQFRDIYDHTFQLIETLDSYMLRTSDLRDLYFTLRAAFTDNVLKTLTVVATIFLPLSFLASFYGMNFTPGFFEPGSSTATGFYSLVTVMLAMSATLLILFRKKGWI